MKKIIECVPNFSEGQNLAVIRQITDCIAAVPGVQLLDVDPGASTNRTVVTLVGEPEAVIEAAFQGIRMAAQVIDMRKHKGAHPRMGATDVCPIIPISGVSIEEAVQYAHRLAKRVGEELRIPAYLYEYAASAPYRRNLADIRAGEYEGFARKIYQAEWKPDYGPQEFNAVAGQTVIGVREFLVAYNINLNSQSEKRANSVAFDIRERGRVVDGPKGEKIQQPGACKHVKAIGWYIEEYGVAQVSANLTNINETPVHVVFEEARKSADKRGLRVTGSELVGLIPKNCLLEAGRYYLAQQKLSQGVSEETLIHIAIKSLGLDELGPFDPKKKIIEYKMLEAKGNKGVMLTSMTLDKFADTLASDAPAPGGGSVAALAGALGASLGAMVANLSCSKKGWESRLSEFSDLAVRGQQLKATLLALVDEDTEAFNAVMAAMRMPKGNDAEIAARKAAVEAANKNAALVPFRTVQKAFSAYEIVSYVAREGNPNAITDAGVAALCIHTAVVGAAFNVRINLGSIADKAFTEDLGAKAKSYITRSEAAQREIMATVESKIG